MTLDFRSAHVFAQTVGLAQDGGNAAASGVLIGRQRANVDISSTQRVYRF
jgi:hypothetical protein